VPHLRELRAQGKLADYSDDELLTIGLIGIWRKPHLPFGRDSAGEGMAWLPSPGEAGLIWGLVARCSGNPLREVLQAACTALRAGKQPGSALLPSWLRGLTALLAETVGA
jgi:hypothetical protein